MTIRHMRIFLEVYREMNITKAAKKLHMTQPAVSRAIQELENHYGIQLFERMNHKLYRTKSGERFYAGSLHIVEAFDELEKGVKNWDKLGILRVGASVTPGNSLLPEAVKEIQKLYPQLQVKAIVSNAANIQQGILKNQIDLAVIEGKASYEEIRCESLAEGNLELIVPPGHVLLEQSRIYLKDVAEYPMLLREKGSAGRGFLDHAFAMQGLELKPVWESTSTRALLNAVAQGLGISILPSLLVSEDLKEGKVAAKKIEDESFRWGNYIIWHRQKFLTPVMEHFVKLCRSLSGQELSGPPGHTR